MDTVIRNDSVAIFSFELSGNSNYTMSSNSNFWRNFELQVTSKRAFELGLSLNYFFELWLPFDLNFELDLNLLQFKKWSHYVAPFHVASFRCLFSGLVVFLTLSTNIQLFSINKCLLLWLFRHEIKANFKGIYFFLSLFNVQSS